MTTQRFSLKCPRCNDACIYDEKNPFRPFCSERCQVADRAAWAEEVYSIPSVSAEFDLE